MKSRIRFHLCMALCVVMLASFSAFAQSSGDVKIGKQIWMSKNLDVSTFRNGDPVPQANNTDEWLNAGKSKSPAWCYYEFDENNGKKYGKLYNWFAVSDTRGLAPKGYHVPSDEEWTVLVDFLGGAESAGKKLKNKDGWNSSEEVLGDNSSGFSGLPGGGCYLLGYFLFIGDQGYWWSSSEYFTDYVWTRNIYNSSNIVNVSYSIKEYGYSVRCIKD